MTTDAPLTGLQLTSHVKSDATIEVKLVTVPVPEPQANEVIIRVDASPINPSDLGLLFGAADMSTARATGTDKHPALTADIPAAGMRAMAGRLDEAFPVGNEGAGLVVKAGSSPQAQALLGKMVGVFGGGMYAQYRCLNASNCWVLPQGATAADGASCYVNPLTALGMVETMRSEGHRALVHTAAASNLGQMLNKICLNDGIALVNIVRSDEQGAMLAAIGATHICNSSASGFMDDLTAALVETGATIAFDAIGGGKLAGQILTCMEAAISKSGGDYSRYGSTVHKQVYIYGMLDHGPTTFGRGFGMAWGVGGWLLMPFLEKLGTEGYIRLRDRVLAELTTTFASHYTREIDLAEMLQPEVAAAYYRRATSEKYLLTPNED
jgi:NADPH:quinone reductase